MSEFDPGIEEELLGQSNQELLAVAGPALLAAFEKHMMKRDDADWDPITYIIGETAAVDDVDDLWTPTGSDGPLIVPDNGYIRPGIVIASEELLEEGRNLSLVARSANYIDGLTENNIPHYPRVIHIVLREMPELIPWLNRWAAEEYRHSIAFDFDLALRQYANPKYVEQARKEQIASGQVPEYDTPGELFIYTSAQELATMIAHRNDARYNPPGIMKRVKAKIASEEADHFMVYYEAALAIREHFPDRFMKDYWRIFSEFEMPGTGIQDFKKHTKVMSDAGVFDVIDIYNIFKYLADKWDIWSIEPMTGQSAETKVNSIRRLEILRRMATRLEGQRADLRERGEKITIVNPFPTPEGLSEEIDPPREKRLGQLAVNTYTK